MVIEVRIVSHFPVVGNVGKWHLRILGSYGIVLEFGPKGGSKDVNIHSLVHLRLEFLLCPHYTSVNM